MLEPVPSKTRVTSSPFDMRRNGLNPSQYIDMDLRLTSTKEFFVECGGETVLRSKEWKKGKHSIVVKKGSHLGEITGLAPVYASAK